MSNYEETTLVELVKKRQFLKLKQELSLMNEVDIALFLEELSNDEAVIVFRMLKKDIASEVFAEIDSETQHAIVNTISDKELTNIVNELAVDDAVDMLEEMPAMVVQRVLKAADPNMRKIINQFMKYKDESAGSIMTPEFIGLHENMTTEEAIQYIRKHGEDKETIYTCYVMDAYRVLQGYVSVKTLLLSDENTKIGEIEDKNVISVTTETDQEEAANLLKKYDFIALPVVDKENRLVGIITIDDAIDVLEKETTEDIETMGALSHAEKPYLKTSVLELSKHRIIWLLVLMVADMLSGGILARWESIFQAMPILISFIPMLTDTGGNAGGQSSTLIIRSLAMGEIDLSNIWEVIWKEIRVALLCGFILSLFNVIRIMIIYPGKNMVAITIGIAMLCTVLMAKTIGGILPLVASKLKMDPAVMASPLITTVVDAGSLLIYLNTAAFLLKI